jgi:hypothetical protein
MHRNHILGLDNQQSLSLVSFEYVPDFKDLRSRKLKNLNIRWGGYGGLSTSAFTQNWIGKANFVYTLKHAFSRRDYLSIGINAGVEHLRFGVTTSGIRYRNDEFIEGLPIITTPSVALGFFYTYHGHRDKQRIHIGLSIPELWQKSLRYANLTVNYETQKFEPSLRLRYVPKINIYPAYKNGGTLPISADVNFRYHSRKKRSKGQERLYAGIGYGTTNIINLEGGFFKNNIRYGINAGFSSFTLRKKVNLGNFVEANALFMF